MENTTSTNQNAQSLTTVKSKGTATILALLLGGLGIHWFYLEQQKKGIWYLIFCWTFIPAIIAFFDFISLANMSKKDFNLKYNSTFVTK